MGLRCSFGNCARAVRGNYRVCSKHREMLRLRRMNEPKEGKRKCGVCGETGHNAQTCMDRTRLGL